jgi:hypothetical protein
LRKYYARRSRGHGATVTVAEEVAVPAGAVMVAETVHCEPGCNGVVSV